MLFIFLLRFVLAEYKFNVRDCQLPLTALTTDDGNYRPVFKSSLEFGLCDLGSFEIEEVLGHGHFGVVSKARHIKSDKQVAIKFQQHNKGWYHFNRNEECIQQELSQPERFPFIAQHYCTVVLSNGTVGYVMEYIEGANLSHIVKKKYGAQKITNGTVNMQKVMAQLAVTLEFLHAHNIVMADLKTGNIMITKEGDMKLIDFGLAIKTLENGQMFKAPQWVSYRILPEHGNNPAVDWYAYGLLLYEVMNGKGVFEQLKGKNSYKSALLSGKFCPDHFDPIACDFIMKFSRVEWNDIWGTTQETRKMIKEHQYFTGLNWADIDIMHAK